MDVGMRERDGGRYRDIKGKGGRDRVGEGGIENE